MTRSQSTIRPCSTPSTRGDLPRVGGVLFLLITLVAIPGCKTTEDLVPPVGAAHAIAADQMGYDLEVIRLGRHIYLNQCIDCHAPIAVDDYTASQWATIMPDMAEESALTFAEEKAVHEYVLATLRAKTITPPQPEVTAPSSSSPSP